MVDDKDPTATVEITSITTKSINVTAGGTDTSTYTGGNSGVKEYQYTCTKPDGTKETVDWTSNKTHTFNEIKYTNNGSFTVGVKVRDKANRESTEVTKIGNLEKLEAVKQGNIVFTAVPPAGQWSKQKVDVTIKNNVSNTSIKYAIKSKSKTSPTQSDYQNYSTPIQITEQDDEIWAELTDGTNISTDHASLKINNIDTVPPTITLSDNNNQTGSVEVENNTINVKVVATDPSAETWKTGQSKLSGIKFKLNRS